jgi:hypothetical protein
MVGFHTTQWSAVTGRTIYEVEKLAIGVELPPDIFTLEPGR